MIAPASLAYGTQIYKPVATAPILARLKHDIERTPRWSRNFGTAEIIPEPFRAYPGQTIPVKNYADLVYLLYDLNPSYLPSRVEALLDTGLCWCNPAWGVMTDSVITGGAVLEVEKIDAGRVYFRSILISDPIPSAEYVLSHHLSTIATSVHRDGRPCIMTRPNGCRNPDGTPERSQVRMFIVRANPEPLWFLAEDVQILEPGFEPPSAVWMP